jgi:hypothetical protein
VVEPGGAFLRPPAVILQLLRCRLLRANTQLALSTLGRFKVLVLATGLLSYVLRISLDLAKESTAGVFGAGFDAICNMLLPGGADGNPARVSPLQRLHKACYHLYCDNYYTSVWAAHMLLQHGIFLTGTLQKRRYVHQFELRSH